MIPIFPTASLAALTATNAALTATRVANATIQHSGTWRGQTTRIPADNDEIGDVELPRKYTVAEIDQMRKHIEWSYPTGVSFNGAERSAEVERRLRTYMMAGIEPKEIAEMFAEALEREAKALEWQKMANAST